MLNKKKINSQENVFALYKQIRSTLKIPLKIQIYFDLLQYSLTQQITEKQVKLKQGFNTQFIRGFLTLNKKQKEQIILANITALYLNYYRIATNDQIQQQHSQRHKQLIKILPNHNKIENLSGKCRILIIVLGLPYWQKTDFNIQSKQNMLNLHYNHTNALDLRMYLIRKSKKHENTLVLQSVSNKVQKSLYKVSLAFKQKQVFSKVFQSIFNCIVTHRNHQLISQFKKSQNQLAYQSNQNVGENNSGIQLSVRPLIFLNQKCINQYLQNKKMIRIYLQHLKNTFYPIYARNDYTIFKSSIDHSFYKLQNTFNKPKNQIKNKFLACFNNYSYIKKSEILQTFSNKYHAIHQKYLIKGRKIQQIIIKQQNSSQNGQILLIKHVDSIINKSFMQFCSFNLSKFGDSACKMTIYGCFNPILLGGPINLILLLEEYINIIKGQTPQPNRDFKNDTFNSFSNEQYFTILDDTPQDNINDFQDLDFDTQKNIDNIIQDRTPFIKKSSPSLNIDIVKNPQSQKQSKQYQSQFKKGNQQTKYLFYKYQVDAIDKNQVRQKIQTENWLQMQWKRTKGGGLVCKNQKIIQQQRKIYKKLLVSFGQQIIKTKGILNLSLPVIIFKKESQLTSMAKTFKMAPYYMQKAVSSKDSLQRFKYCLATMVSINSLNLSFQKPFNPILGQTLQLYVNGCPLYIEQISHHPPKTSYYFVGRGFKLYGTAAIKIDIGLNNAKGYSQLEHTIQFDNGDKIYYLFPKLCIGGLLLGDRTFNFEGKTFMFDPLNKYFADIFFGQTKKTFFASDSHPLDEISGKIYKVKQSFQKLYESNKLNIIIQKTHIQNQLSSIGGIWNQGLKINNQQYSKFIGSDADPVFQLQSNQNVLPSDSRYRSDLIYLIQGNLDKAQDAKVQLEEIQRRDRKLRSQYAQKNK